MTTRSLLVALGLAFALSRTALAQSTAPGEAPAGKPATASAGAGKAGVKEDSPPLPPLPPGLPANEFDDVKKDVSPLSPAQIRELKKLIDNALEAEETPARPPPKAVSYSLKVSLAPGEAPPTIRTASRFVTSIVFVDALGSPWPVVGFSIGDEKRFDVVQPGKGGNVLTITPKKDYASASLAVFLQDSPTPVSVLLVSGQKEVDTRVDLKMQGRGPKAATPVLDLPPQGDQYLLSFLDGVIPEGAKALAVRGGAAEAWSFAKKMYLKTRLSIISPAWRDSVQSSDGTTVYVMPEASLVLASLNGNIVSLRVNGL
jgi:intracellular multiplication protein IcmK